MAGSQCGAEVVAEGDRQGKNEPTYLTKSINQTINQTCPRGCNNYVKIVLLLSAQISCQLFRWPCVFADLTSFSIFIDKR